jgi:hypothetical protein
MHLHICAIRRSDDVFWIPMHVYVFRPRLFRLTISLKAKIILRQRCTNILGQRPFRPLSLSWERVREILHVPPLDRRFALGHRHIADISPEKIFVLGLALSHVARNVDQFSHQQSVRESR